VALVGLDPKSSTNYRSNEIHFYAMSVWMKMMMIMAKELHSLLAFLVLLSSNP
jgi:hypothetical protein